MQILTFNSKLLTPKTEGTVQRKRFFPLFDKILSQKVTSVVAAAGYGKTVLAAQAVEYLKVKTFWYQLDEYDNDFSVFFSYLNRGIGKHWPSIESKLTPLLQNNPVSQREIRVLLSALLLEIENHIDEDVLIVLDDFHFILKNEVINNVLKYLLDLTFRT